MDISIIHGVGSEEIREYILRNPRSLIYAEPRFLGLVAGQLEASVIWLIARKEGEIIGLLPLLVKGGPLGPAFNSLAYYGGNGGVIQVKSDVTSKRALINAFYDMALEQKAVSATIISNPLECDAEFYELNVVYDFRDERIGQITHLPSSAEELISCFDDPRPRNIRRAIKDGVTIVRNSKNALKFLFDTHADNMARINGLPKNHTFFYSIPLQMHKDDWAIFTAEIDGKPVAALLLFYFNRTVEYFTPVIVESHRSTQALALVIYQAMCDAIQRGFTNWNWGGTWLSQGGVYDFKKRWGTTEYRYFYYTRVMNEKLRVCKPEFLLKNYPGFFLIPFDQLVET